MPYFLVDIRGDAHLAVDMLAKAGIQDIVSKDDPTGRRVSARVSADDEESAVRRVLFALAGEPYTVTAVRREGAQ